MGHEPVEQSSWQSAWRCHWSRCRPLLLLAATATAELAGISAAGATAVSRRLTAAADTELLLLGPGAQRPHALPPLPAGVSPALIGHSVLRQLGLLPRTLVVDLGCAVAPATAHLRLPPPEAVGPAACLSSGAAMGRQRVVALLERGRSWGRQWPQHEPLLLAECVPGGTSTALAVLLGLGLAAEGLVSGSLLQPAHGLKSRLARQGLAAACLEIDARGVDPLAVLAAVGDPMQALAAGLTWEASARGVPVLLAGGSQMAAVLALALALAPADQRQQLASQAVVATTAWLAEEPHSDLAELLALISQRWRVRAQLAVASLRFDHCRSQALRDYERGYVKEGVGAGGFALLWELSGRPAAELAALCDADCERLLNSPWLGGA
jgi:uncharacterized protein (TIGR00303 family)